jgi:hypothetical protein
MCSGRRDWDAGPFVFLSAPQLPADEQASPAMCSHHNTGATIEPMQPMTETMKLWAKETTLLSCLSCVFCHIDAKLTNMAPIVLGNVFKFPLNEFLGGKLLNQIVYMFSKCLIKFDQYY